MKLFKEELRRMYDRLISGNNFAFSKYADGEWSVMTNKAIGNGEFSYDPNNDAHYEAAKMLCRSFFYTDKDYYVGISCPCCAGIDHFRMKENCPSLGDNLTFANIFVNTNYKLYKELFLKEYEKRNIWLVANENSKIENLTFKIEKFFPVGNTAFVNDLDVIQNISSLSPEGKLILFACGPLGNIATAQLWVTNKANTYLDIGSTLNPWLESEGFKRDYYMGVTYANRTCFWSE